MKLKALCTIHTPGGVFSPGDVFSMKDAGMDKAGMQELIARGAAADAKSADDDSKSGAGSGGAN